MEWGGEKVVRRGPGPGTQANRSAVSFLTDICTVCKGVRISGRGGDVYLQGGNEGCEGGRREVMRFSRGLLLLGLWGKATQPPRSEGVLGVGDGVRKENQRSMVVDSSGSPAGLRGHT